MGFSLIACSVLFTVPASPGFTVTTVDALDLPQRLAAADLDGNHRVDLFVVADGPDGSRLQVLLNHGGHFTPGWTKSYANGPGGVFDVDLADTDNDGDRDVVFCIGIGAPGQLFNDGLGNFDALGLVPTLSVRFENELVDINGNGTTDLVYYEPDFFFDTYFGTQVGDGQGHFGWASYTEYKLSADLELHRRIAIGDLTGDGLKDAVFTSVITGGIRFFEGSPTPPGKQVPGWKQPVVIYVPPCNDAAMADLDGDGRLDLIATAPSLDSVVVFLTQPNGAVGPPQLYAAGQTPDALASADFDLDGRPDVIVANPASGKVHVLRGTGSGGLGPPRGVPVGQSPSDVATADLDNDGDIDAAVACADHVAVLVNLALAPTAHFTQK